MFELKQINEAIVLGILDLKAFFSQNPHFSKRELEKNGSLYVIHQILKDDSIQIEYSNQGKPFLKGRTEHISISHSHDYLAVIINKLQNTGCDVELIRDKVKTVQHKFLTVIERKATDNDIEKLIIYWAAKETLYKIHGLKALDFKKNLFISDFDNTKIIGKITNNECTRRFLLKWEKFDNYILVYCLNEI